MLRKKKDNSDYEIDRELTGKFAIEKNAEYQEKIEQLEEENKKLKEFKTKREETMFYFKALAERVEPINSKEAEELQRYKKLFERLYREELHYLEEENKKLKEELEDLRKYSVKLTGMAVTYKSVKEREEKQKEQIEKCKLILLGINEKLIEEIFGED